LRAREAVAHRGEVVIDDATNFPSWFDVLLMYGGKDIEQSSPIANATYQS